MPFRRLTRPAIAGAVALATIANAPLASAATCFTLFGGGTHLQFQAGLSSFTAAGTRSVPGVIFGNLSSCAGLSKWPVLATVTTSGNGAAIILGFRAMTVDASGCGAVDYIANLDGGTVSGPVQLHNDRNNFSNTDTLTLASCVAPPLATEGAARMAAGQHDIAGNAAE